MPVVIRSAKTVTKAGAMPMNEKKWFLCPHCGQKLFQVAANAVIRGMEIKCKRCKQILNVSL